MQKSLAVILVASLSAVAACSDGVGPQERGLDGPWSTGPTADGLIAALEMEWTHDRLSGSGSYSVIGAGVRCGLVTIRGNGTVVLTGIRPTSTEIRGQMTFGSGPSLAYQGNLVDTLPVHGFARIHGTLVAADGTECPLTLFQGLIP